MQGQPDTDSALCRSMPRFFHRVGSVPLLPRKRSSPAWAETHAAAGGDQNTGGPGRAAHRARPALRAGYARNQRPTILTPSFQRPFCRGCAWRTCRFRDGLQALDTFRHRLALPLAREIVADAGAEPGVFRAEIRGHLVNEIRDIGLLPDRRLGVESLSCSWPASG
jgi:hypothetical protein